MVFSDLIALYLFLGGTSAAAYAFMSLIDVIKDYPSDNPFASCGSYRFAFQSVSYITRRRISQLVYGISFIGLLFGLGCLLADLGRPEFFYMLFLLPTSSLMTFGSFALTGLVVCLALALMSPCLDKGIVFKKAVWISKIIGIPIALFVAVYTGLLLKSVVAVSLWQSYWLPALFLASALSCGCGLILLCSAYCADFQGSTLWARRISYVDMCCIVLEIVFCVILIYSINSSYATSPFDVLLFGELSLLFWGGFVTCGLVLPLCIEIFMILRARVLNRSFVCVLGSFILVGGLCLRFALVFAGVHVF